MNCFTEILSTSPDGHGNLKIIVSLPLLCLQSGEEKGVGVRARRRLTL